MSSTRDRIDTESRKDPERLEREIDQQRDTIGSLLGALEDKISPSEIVDRVMRASNINGSDFARNLGNVVRSNPLPTLLATAGLAWLYASRHDSAPVHDDARRVPEHYSGSARKSGSSTRFDGEHDSGNGIGDKASQLREGAADLRESASEKLSDAKQRAGETAHHAADSIRHQAGRARDGFSHLMEDNPLVVGAIAIGIGALLGAAVPVTQKEDELMGQAGDKLRGKVGEAGQAVREKGREAVEAARDIGSESASTIKDAVGSVTGRSASPGATGASGSASASESSTSRTTTGSAGNVSPGSHGASANPLGPK